MSVNWTPFLQWSLAQHDGTRPTDIKPMSEEDKEWLSKVMDSLVVDEAKRMRIIAEVLQWPEEPEKLRADLATSEELHLMRPMRAEGQDKDAIKDEEKVPIPSDDKKLIDALVAKKEEALEELDDLVLTIDKACDFHTVGGFPHLFNQLKSSHASLRKLAAQALATIVQNNPKAQTWAMEYKPFTYIRDLILDTDPNVVAKGILLMSSLVRQNDLLTKELCHQGGIELLLIVLQRTTHDKVRSKALRLLRYFVETKPVSEDASKRIVSAKPFALLLSLVGTDNVDIRDNSAGLLVDLLKAHPKESKAMLLDPKLQAARVLGTRVKKLGLLTSVEDKDMIAEELEYLQTIMQLLFARAPTVDKDYQALVVKREQEEKEAREADAARRREAAKKRGEEIAIQEARRRELGQQQLLQHQQKAQKKS